MAAAATSASMTRTPELEDEMVWRCTLSASSIQLWCGSCLVLSLQLLPSRAIALHAHNKAWPAISAPHPPSRTRWGFCVACTLVLGVLSAPVAEDLCSRWRQQGIATGCGVRAAWAVRPRLIRTLHGARLDSDRCLEAGGGTVALEISVCVGVLFDSAPAGGALPPPPLPRLMAV